MYVKFIKKLISEKNMEVLHRIKEDYILEDSAKQVYKLVKENALKGNWLTETELSVMFPKIDWSVDVSIELETLIDLVLRKWCEQELRRIFRQSINNSDRDIKTIISSLHSGIEKLYLTVNQNIHNVIKSGWYSNFLSKERYELPWHKLNEVLFGITKGHFWAILGRYKIGKTFFVQKFALDIWKKDAQVLFASAEMNSEDLLMRMGTLLYGIPYAKIVKGELQEEHVCRLNSLSNIMKQQDKYFIILGKEQCTLENIYKLHTEFNFDVIFIDSFYRLGYANSEYERVNEVLNFIMQLCQNAAVVVTSQYNREGSKASNISDPTLYTAYNLNIVRLADVVLGLSDIGRDFICISLLASRYSESNIKFVVKNDFNTNIMVETQENVPIAQISDEFSGLQLLENNAEKK